MYHDHLGLSSSDEEEDEGTPFAQPDDFDPFLVGDDLP